MKYIVPIAVAAILLLHLSDAVPKSSVGGAFTVALTYLAAALTVGIYEAWSNRRGVLGWIVSIFTAFVGGVIASFIGAELIDVAMGLIVPLIKLEGSLAETRHPLLYVLSAGMMLITLFGAWFALWLVNKLRGPSASTT